jgi:hypothetical protein
MYSFWYNATTLPPTGATVEMERQFTNNTSFADLKF